MENKTIYLGNAIYANFSHGKLFVRNAQNVIVFEEQSIGNLIDYIKYVCGMPVYGSPYERKVVENEKRDDLSR